MSNDINVLLGTPYTKNTRNHLDTLTKIASNSSSDDSLRVYFRIKRNSSTIKYINFLNKAKFQYDYDINYDDFIDDYNSYKDDEEIYEEISCYGLRLDKHLQNIIQVISIPKNQLNFLNIRIVMILCGVIKTYPISGFTKSIKNVYKGNVLDEVENYSFKYVGNSLEWTKQSDLFDWMLEDVPEYDRLDVIANARRLRDEFGEKYTAFYSILNTENPERAAHFKVFQGAINNYLSNVGNKREPLYFEKRLIEIINTMSASPRHKDMRTIVDMGHDVEAILQWV